MNKEIKEILDSWRNKKHILAYTFNYDSAREQNDKLLDYITNLQQENEDNLKCIKSLKEQLESVINENQRLLKQWFEDNDKTVKLVSEKEYYKQNFNDYKSRCEKAIEYLDNKLKLLPHYMYEKEMYDLLNILQGSEDNE